MNEMADVAKPLALRDENGRLFGYACPRCLEGRFSISGGGYDEAGMSMRADWSLRDASRCCVCRRCGAATSRRSICEPCERMEDADRAIRVEAERPQWEEKQAARRTALEGRSLAEHMAELEGLVGDDDLSDEASFALRVVLDKLSAAPPEIA